MDIASTLKYIETIIKSPKVQFMCAISFGIPLYIFNDQIDVYTKIALMLLFLLAVSALLYSFFEKIYNWAYRAYKRGKAWNNLTPEELDYISYYITNNRKYRYVVAYNGTYKDSGIINPLIRKKILYMASNLSEYRGEHFMAKDQCFPFNIYDDAFEFFKKKLNAK